MWLAELVDGSRVGHPSNFLEISQPIRRLSIPGAKIVLDGCSKYYMVFHAVAAVGQQGRVEAIEIGGLAEDDRYHGVSVMLSGKLEEKIYTKEEFPYQPSLKPGDGEAAL